MCWLSLWGIEWVSLCELVVFMGDRMGQSLCVGCVYRGIEWVSLYVLVVFLGDKVGLSLCVGCVFRG